jgi:hypothetical protein
LVPPLNWPARSAITGGRPAGRIADHRAEGEDPTIEFARLLVDEVGGFTPPPGMNELKLAQMN